MYKEDIYINVTQCCVLDPETTLGLALLGQKWCLRDSFK